MRKSLAALAVVLFCTVSVFAQTGKAKAALGFKAGLNLSSFRTAVDYTNYEADIKPGFALGAFVEIPVSRKFLFQPEFLYSQMGAKSFDDFWGHKTLFYNYFSIPLQVKYKVCHNLNVLAGPQLDFLLRAKEKDDFGHSSIVSNDIKDFDCAITAGFEVWLSKNVVVGARYIHGTQDVSTTPEDNTLFNQGVQFSLGWKLTKKAKKSK